MYSTVNIITWSDNHMDIERIKIEYMPKITDDQLYDFYVRNDICEAGHGKEAAVKPLKYSPYMVGAFYEGKLVGIVRAVFDGLTAVIMEFCLELELQGDNLQYDNGSIIEKDQYDIAKKMGILLIDELRKIGNTFVSAVILQHSEQDVYTSIGFKFNEGHAEYIIDERPYVLSEIV
jgi:hypothetical protein